MHSLDRVLADPLTLDPGTPRYRPRGVEEALDVRFGGSVSQRSRIARNLQALHWLVDAQRSGRVNDHMQERIARWSGWGAVPALFDEHNEDHAEDRRMLREYLGPELYAAASRSTINAHYTDPDLVRVMWDSLRTLGFEEGSVLEPGSGSGHFIGAVPEGLLEGTHVTGVELDPVAANISRALYPDATVRTESFADSPLRPASFDAVIGNVPFGSVRLYDPRHNAAGLPIHDHFLVKSIDLLRPGGTAVLLTSHYTLDKADQSARKAIFEQADLLAAVRLPTGSHRRGAGTEVVTDVLVLRRRREGEQPGDDAWLTSSPFAQDVRINDYFTAHPEHLIGEAVLGHGLYGKGLEVKHGSLSEVPDLLVERLSAALATSRDGGRGHDPERAPEGVRINVADLVGQALDEAEWLAGHIAATDDGFVQMIDGDAEPLSVPKSGHAEMRALLALRDTTRALLDAEAQTLEDTDATRALRARLNTQYDQYLDRYGPINRITHRRTGRVDEQGNEVLARVLPRTVSKFNKDPFAPPVRALELFDEATGKARKAPIFHRRVIERRAPVTSADNPADALAVSMDQRGEVDLPLIAELMGSTESEVREALGTLVFDDPAAGALVPAAEYLSGDVRSKLGDALAAAAENPAYQVNVDALGPIVPTDLGPEEIHASFGAVWIPAEDVQQFLRETLDDPSVEVSHGSGAMWSVTGNRRSVAARSTWGTDRLSALEIVSRLLQQQETVVRDEVELPDGGTTRVVNPEATDAAAEKAAALRERFAEWVWADEQRSERLSKTYNTMFNSTVLRSYDGDHLTLPGLATWFTPHPHQRAAVHRITAEPSVGLFHQVGAGKTAEMVMGAMELRRLGMVRKPAIVVPNHMLEQFSREFLALYPRANVLAAGREDLAKDKRRLFVAQAATGDWDAIIMTRGAFQALPVSVDTEKAYMSREQDALRESLARMAGDQGADTRMVKRMERQLLNNEERLKKAMDQRRDAGLTFEQLGIDYLMVDELHDYKNMRVVSSIRDAAHPGSQRAIDLDMKLDYLRRANGDRVFTGATATPIANSVAEAYVMQRYIRPELLDDVGITDFDSWAATFGETLTQVELAPEGGGNYRTNTRFARFRNVPELLRLWHVAADVKTAEDLPYLKRPELRERADGQRSPESVLINPSTVLQEYVSDLGERAEKVRGRMVDPTEDNMLKVSGDGRAAALDLRLVGLEPPGNQLFEVPTKLEVAADRIVQVWLEHRDTVYPDAGGDGQHPATGALQLVFSDLGTPTGTGFDAYGHLRDLLADRGMDPSRIRFIHEASNEAKKAALFEQCRTGGVDVLIGSTSKMGVGTNIQARAVALHHLDCPWRPADIEQREGRILRQGNHNAEVGIYRYVVEGSFDAYSWQTVERKAKFIDQLMRGSLDRREIEDIGDSTLSFNEVKALASGDPLILDRAEVEQEIATLSRLQRSHAREQTGLRHSITNAERDIAALESRVPRIEAAITRSRDTRGDAFRATVGGTPTSERPAAATAVRHLMGQHQAALDRTARPESAIDGVLTLGGHAFDGQLRLTWIGDDVVQLRLKELPEVTLDVNLAETGHGLITRAENTIAGLPGYLEATRSDLARAIRERDSAQSSLGAPFPRAAELSAAQERLADIDKRMSAAQGPAPEGAPVQEAPARVDACEAATPTMASQYIEEIRQTLQRSSRAAERPMPPPGGGHTPRPGLGM